jgi:ABC-2 type transport system permease protein
MMFTQAFAILQKDWAEWRTILFVRGMPQPALLPILLLTAAFAIYEPSRLGPEWAHSGIMVFSSAVLVPALVAGTLVPSAYAGERNSRTLEPLLATPVSDTALLFGKMGLPVFSGWAVGLVTVLIGLGFVQLAYPLAALPTFSFDSSAFVVALCFQTSLLVAAVGTIVSLRAPTILVAEQKLSAFLMAILVGPAFFVGPLAPALWRSQLAGILVAIGTSNAMLALIIVLAALNIGVIFVALRRFNRSTLLLA